MRLSFVIPAHDEESVIGPTLGAVRAAAGEVGEAFEVVVVDDDSSDRTAVVAEGAGARVVRTARRQIAAARNAGAAVAQGDVFVFVDADTLVTADAVRGVVEAIRGGAVGGGAAVRFDEPIPAYLRYLVPIGIWGYRRLGFAFGCFLFCTREAFRAAGGFDERLFAGEEMALSRALGKQGRFVLLRQCVVTSGRKLRTHSIWELLKTPARFTLRGFKALQDRSRLELWYGPRRKDAAGR